ncbi:MAG: capsule assembly Wzi family protein [Pseudomonadales bacterium]|nr:capsule assembly Wzi family protein [Pseudomonadales bacterium]
MKAYADPWLDHQDARLRHSLDVGLEYGVSQSPVSTWPMLWGNYAGRADFSYSQLRHTDHPDSPNIQQETLSHLQFTDRQARDDGIQIEKKSTIASGYDLNPGFSTPWHEKKTLALSINYNNNFSASQLSVETADDPFDNKKFRFDNSYVSLALSNWVLGVGTQTQWWGPGWDNSLLLSNNARPTPSLFLQRNYSKPDRDPANHWMGNWQLRTFISTLEQSREDDKDFFSGARLNSRFGQSLELGLSYLMEWGDKQKSEIDQNSRTSNSVSRFGFDVSYSMSVLDHPVQIYGQFVQENDRAQNSHNNYELVGISSHFSYGKNQYRLFLEANDTRKNLLQQNQIPNYTYRGRSIGATFEGARQTSLGLFRFHPDGSEIHLKYSQIRDGKRAISYAAPDQFGIASLTVKFPLMNSYVSTAVSYSDDAIGLKKDNQREPKFSASLQWQYRFN